MRRHPLVAVLVAERKARGWTQLDLARATGKTVPAINHFENDPGGRNLSVIEEVAAGLGMRLELVPVARCEQLRAAS